MNESKMTLAERARKLKEFSPLTKGREKIETTKLIGEELTIDEFDIVSKLGGENPFAIIVFREYPKFFLFAGSVMTELLIDLMNSYDSKEEMLQALKEEEFKIKMVTRQSKNNGRRYTDIEII